MLTNGVSKNILPNGLTVLVKENRAWPVVAIVTYVKAGYFNEPDQLVGISHMIEHMFFKGTPRRSVGQIAAETKSLGGYLNASTIYDHTLYYTVLPSQHLAQGLDIQSDALINAVFDQDELRKEIEVVIEEAKRKLDTPAAVAREKLFELAFDSHRIRRWRIGTEEGLRALTRDDFVAFHSALYRPANIVLAVVGDVDTDLAFSQIEKYYGPFETGVLEKEESPPELPQSDLKYRFMKGEIQQAQLLIGFKAPQIFHPDSYAVEILCNLLGRGRSSRLFRNVKEEKDLVNTITAFNYALPTLGILLVEANVAPEKLRPAATAIFDELASACTEKFDDESLNKARTLIESSYVAGLESASGQANVLAEFEALGDFRLAEEYLQKLYEVTSDDLLRVARKYLKPTNCSVLEYVPTEAKMQAGDFEAISARLEELRDQHTVASTRPPRAASEQRRSLVARTGGDGRIVQQELENGVQLLVKENHQLPLVSVGIFAKGGRCGESAAIAGISSLALRTALKGTKTRDAATLALEIEQLGSSIHYSNDPDYMGFSMNILSQHFESGLDLLAEVIVAPTFPNDELAKEKGNLLATQLRQRDDMFRYPLHLLYTGLFNGHAYGLSAIGDRDSIEGLKREDVVAWHSEHWTAQNLLVVLVGDLKTETAAELLGEHLSSIGSARSNGNGRVQPSALLTTCEHFEERPKEQTALAMGFRGPTYLEEDYYALTVLQNVLSGLGGRFFEELRGRQSLAYTVSSFLVARLVGGAFVSYIATSPDKEEAARSGLLKEFRKLLDAPISEKELRQAIEFTKGTHQIALETNRAQMFQYAHSVLMSKGHKEIERFSSRISEVTVDEILDVARKYFDLDSYALGGVRGRSGPG